MPEVLETMHKAAHLDKPKFAGDPTARWTQHKTLLREASRVVRDRRALSGGSGATSEEIRAKLFMTLARAMGSRDTQALRHLCKHWAEFAHIVEEGADGYELVDATR